MRSFPTDFRELLNDDGRKAFEARPANGGRAVVSTPRLSLFDNIMDAAAARACVRLLDRHMYPRLRHLEQPIPRNSISSMKENYGERLPKTMSMNTCFLQSRRYREYSAAENMGLIAMLQSECLRSFAESITGHTLTRGTCQAICYEPGDYAGPHNDHHPQNDLTKNGYVDLHIMFGNDAVDHQWLVYERDRHLQEIRNVNLSGGIAVYRLPFWHYVTPLAAKPGREKEARRWLLLVSYYFASKPRN